MSWADDIRCLFCDGRLPLYRKITNGQFCSTAHRKAYWQEQERLAVERLHQTHDSLRAYRPLGQGTVEAILGNAGLAETAADTPVIEERPWWLPQVNAGQVPMAELLPNPMPAQPRWLSEDRAVGNFQPIAPPNSLRPPVNVHRGTDCGFSAAGTVRLDKIDPRPVNLLPSTEATLIEPRVHVLSYPVIRLMVERVEQEDQLLKQTDEEIPQIAGLRRIPIRDAVDCRTLPAGSDSLAPNSEIRRPLRPLEILAEEIPQIGRLPIPLPAIRPAKNLPEGPAPVSINPRTCLPGRTTALNSPRLSPSGMRGLRPAPPSTSANREQPGVAELRPAGITPAVNLNTPALQPGLRLSGGCRYPIRQRNPEGLILASELRNLSGGSTGITLPEHTPKVMRAAAGQSVQTAPSAKLPEPARMGPVPMPGLGQPNESSAEMRPAPLAMTLPQPPRAEPLRPASHLEPLDAKPIADVFAPPPVVEPVHSDAPPEQAAVAATESSEPPADENVEPAKVHFWTHGVDFWNHAPRDLKILLFAIPVLIALAVHPPLPKVHVSAANGTKIAETGFRRSLNEQWVSVRQSVLDRAAIALDEDFRSGLDAWVSRGDAPTEWSFDATGFVKPGPLAMFRPSLGLADYQLQFLGLIDKKALSWVVRASDFENYYVIKLVVLKPGPLPQLGLVRYAVVNGKADARGDTVVPIDARSDTLYRVNLEVHGDDFALYVQGQMVDAWSEPRLRQGGVGFFSARGEESRLRWVQVTHQYDMLGKLCAYLAPYNIPSTSGSWQP